MSDSNDNEQIPRVRLTGHLPGHIKARPGHMAKPVSTQEREAATFFEKPNFAVAGASSDENKFGYKSMLTTKTRGGTLKTCQSLHGTISIRCQ